MRYPRTSSKTFADFSAVSDCPAIIGEIITVYSQEGGVVLDSQRHDCQCRTQILVNGHTWMYRLATSYVVKEDRNVRCGKSPYSSASRTVFGIVVHMANVNWASISRGTPFIVLFFSSSSRKTLISSRTFVLYALMYLPRCWERLLDHDWLGRRSGAMVYATGNGSDEERAGEHAGD